MTGAADGAFDKATFYRPQGMALAGDNLYVADTENHLIRRVDLKTRTVETIAGTGQQSREYFKTGPARTVALNSPWDLATGWARALHRHGRSTPDLEAGSRQE